jgi:hypothetical protein
MPVRAQLATVPGIDLYPFLLLSFHHEDCTHLAAGLCRR